MSAPADPRFPRRMTVSAAPRALDIGIVCSRFPMPMTRADQMTVAHLLAFLAARGHHVDLFSLTDAKPAGLWLDWVAAQCARVALFEQPWWRRCLGVLGAVVRRRPVQVGWFANRALGRVLRRAAQTGRYDVIYAYTLRAAEPARDLGCMATTYLAMQVSQALNTQRIAAQGLGAFERWLYRVEHHLTARYEARVWRGFTHTTLIGETDVAAVRAACKAAGQPPMDNHMLAPHGVDADRFRPRQDIAEVPLRLAFCGVMATNTNVSAALWFVREVWPALRASVPDASLAIVGRLPRPEILALHGREGILVTGEVPDPAAEIARAAVCVDPMQAGAGMQNKLLEYLATGRAVVATSVANEGIGATPGEHLLVADGGRAFAQAVAHLLRDRTLRRRLGAAARAYILREWSWERHFLRLEEHFLSAAAGRSAR